MPGVGIKIGLSAGFQQVSQVIGIRPYPDGDLRSDFGLPCFKPRLVVLNDILLRGLS